MLTALNVILLLTSFLLCLQQGCCSLFAHLDDLDIPENVLEDHLYVNFQANTLDQLYDCLCDMEIIECRMTYDLRQETTASELSLYITVSNLRQTRAANGSSEAFKPSIVCDIRDYSAQREVLCNRQTAAADGTCEQAAAVCLVYSVQQDATLCTYGCSQMTWVSDYALKLEFSNLGTHPEPVEDGICPPTPVTTSSTSSPTPSSTSGTEITNVSTINATHATPENTAETSHNLSLPGVSDFENSTPDGERESSSLLIPIAVTGGVSLLIIATAVVYLARRFGCRQEKNDVPASVSDESVSNSDSFTENRTSSGSQGTEEEGYQTLDEVTEEVMGDTKTAACDNKGYDTIHDCLVRRDVFEKCSRPLPDPPAAGERLSTKPSSSTSSSSVPGLSSPSAIGASAATTERLPSSAPSLNQHDEKARPSDGGPKPTPHRRHVDLENYEYMGEVSLRRDHPALSSRMRAKLVRTQWGDMELISLPEELSVFTDYYSRLQLASTPDTSGSLGVVGLSDQMFDNDSHKYFDLLGVDRSDLIHNSAQWTSTDSTKQEKALQHPYKSKTQYPYVFYFGTVDLAQDANISSSDYLTVLDIDASFTAASNQDYLTVIDLQPTAESSGSEHFTTQL